MQERQLIIYQPDRHYRIRVGLYGKSELEVNDYNELIHSLSFIATYSPDCFKLPIIFGSTFLEKYELNSIKSFAEAVKQEPEEISDLASGF